MIKIVNSKDLRHPRKDRSCINSQARRKAKALGGHCECFEKQALTFILINQLQHHNKQINKSFFFK
ncbi:hypothetical protein N665_0264s0029 [Sinapis alba]|nr:hypothetical protein N665_0264s0029 [Sinapis alba]